MQVDAVHVNVNQERQVDGSGSRSDTAKAAKAAKASPRREARARKEERKRSPSLMVNAGTGLKRKDEVRHRCGQM